MDANVFRALGHPDRLRIVELLKSRDRTVNEIVLSLGVSQPNVSKHLAVLRDVHLVKVEARGQERVYQLNRRVPTELSAWASRVAEYEVPAERTVRLNINRDYTAFERGFTVV